MNRKKYDYDLIVIGAGAAGLTCSTGAGGLGAKVLLIEKDKQLGGDCLHYGCVPSKSLIKSAYCYQVMKQARKYGLPTAEVPGVDFQSVRDRIQNIIGIIQKHDSPQWLKEKYNVETAFGKPAFLDEHTLYLDGQKITARSFVIATGSSPAVPDIDGLSQVPFLTNRSIFSLEKLPPAMIVLGGGPIGLEMAQAFGRLGTKITLIQSGPQILPKEDTDVADFMHSRLQNEGIQIFLNTKAVKVFKEGGLVKVIVEHQNQNKIIFGQSLLIATGRKPNVEGLDLEKAGVRWSPQGIAVDCYLRTTAKNIYACGDVHGKYFFTHVAGYEGGMAMVNAVMRIPLKADYTKVPWCTYLDPEVASIGYNEKRAREAGIGFTIQKEEFAENDRALAESETEGFIKILINKKGKPIGVQIVGYHAGDLIHEWVAVLNGKVGLSTVAQAIHAYPTLSEINKKVSGNYLAPKLFNKTVRKALKVLFGLQGNP